MNDLRKRAEAVVRELDTRRALPVRNGPALIETRARGGQASNETSKRLETFTSSADFERVRAELIAILDALSDKRSVGTYREAVRVASVDEEGVRRLHEVARVAHRWATS